VDHCFCHYAPWHWAVGNVKEARIPSTADLWTTYPVIWDMWKTCTGLPGGQTCQRRICKKFLLSVYLANCVNQPRQPLVGCRIVDLTISFNLYFTCGRFRFLSVNFAQFALKVKKPPFTLLRKQLLNCLILEFDNGCKLKFRKPLEPVWRNLWQTLNASSLQTPFKSIIWWKLRWVKSVINRQAFL
jgi:hypothetical protein